MLEREIVGCLQGMAVGDALGLPREGLSPRRAALLFPNANRFYFLFGRGMFSDDTEHACMTAQSLLVSDGDPARFRHTLGWRLRWWLLGMPLSIGRATSKSIVKLWFGASLSGVWSAGNGPAMRAPILGVCFGNQPDRLRELIRISTQLTHLDPKAQWGALVIARAAYLAAQSSDRVLKLAEAVRDLISVLPAEAVELFSLIEHVGLSIEASQTTEAFAAELGLSRGISGYMLHTVPVVLHAWLSFPDDYRAAVQAVIRCGGDADSTAALVGGIVGARVGKEGIPQEWRRGLCEWPRDLRWMERLGHRLAEALASNQPRKSVPLSIFGLIARNLLFNMVVVAHVLRRLLPPY
ncbi:MAG: ADP-ribosylglycohydrolase family protein [Planctomycetes bacterium]|nr:ADP-ribosylglycohydrolase family protein [Planctomycetota bacterium]